ncbi:MAG: NAD(P)H-hydrate dehydratase [Gilvibacter sp.]
MKIFSAQQLYAADKATIKRQQLAPTLLMERAGEQVYNWLHSRMQGAQVPVRIFCGIGNNGGDGLVLGRMLIESGYNVHTYVVNCSDKRSKNFLTNYDRIKNVTKNWPTLIKSEEDFPEIHRDDVVVDAIFGIGLNRCMDGWVKGLIVHMNTAGAFILAIDTPSGLYANMAIEDPEAIVRANHTLTFQFPKLSFFMPQTGVYTQTWEALDIGLDAQYVQETPAIANYLTKGYLLQWYTPRQKFSYKGDYGHCMVIGGSYGKIGAIHLTAKAALKTGAGLATAYVPECGYQVLQTSLPEAMLLTDTTAKQINTFPIPDDKFTYVIGMGMGTAKETADGFKAFLKDQKQAVVLDADAINILAGDKKMQKLIPAGSILTPHEGELKGLLGPWTDDFNKLQLAKDFTKAHQCVIVIKGAHTLTVFNDTVFVNASGNPGMATAGSGDVLSGMIAGFLAQKYEPWQAAAMGVYLHGSAGDLAVNQEGYQAIIASSIVDSIGAAFIKLFEPDQPPPQENAQGEQ